ncbi:MAG: hypothetical protein U0175_39060 [Caldilineaceae bacterium]
MTAPANSVSMQVQYLLYQSSGWVNIDDVEVTVVASAAASEVTKYYYFGGQRVAMRKNGVLTYLHADHPSATLGNHLGSTVLKPMPAVPWLTMRSTRRTANSVTQAQSAQTTASRGRMRMAAG